MGDSVTRTFEDELGSCTSAVGTAVALAWAAGAAPVKSVLVSFSNCLFTPEADAVDISKEVFFSPRSVVGTTA